MSCQNIAWFQWPPPLLRTAVRMSSGTVPMLHQLVEALVVEFGVLVERGVQIRHVGLVVLAVMDLHRLGVDVRFERRGVVRQRRQGMSHGTGLLKGADMGGVAMVAEPRAAVPVAVRLDDTDQSPCADGAGVAGKCFPVRGRGRASALGQRRRARGPYAETP